MLIITVANIAVYIYWLSINQYNQLPIYILHDCQIKIISDCPSLRFWLHLFPNKTANQSCMKYTVYCTVYLTVNTSDILKALIFKLLFLSIPSFKICLFCPDHRNILRLVRKEWSQIPGSGARMPCVEHTVHCTGSRFGTKQVSRIFF